MFTTIQYDIIIGTGAGGDVHRAITAQSNAPSKLARFSQEGVARQSFTAHIDRAPFFYLLP